MTAPTVTVTITATIPVGQYHDFLRRDPDLASCFAAALHEVIGERDALLTPTVTQFTVTSTPWVE